MTNPIVAAIIAGAVGALIFISIFIGTALGALAGYLLSLTFLGDYIIIGFGVFDINATGKLTMIGALFGFLAGFFKPNIEVKK